MPCQQHRNEKTLFEDQLYLRNKAFKTLTSPSSVNVIFLFTLKFLFITFFASATLVTFFLTLDLEDSFFCVRIKKRDD